jgi:hypothetical protein
MIENISLVFLVLALVCFLVGRSGIVKPAKRRYYPLVLRTPDSSRYRANVEPEPAREDAKSAFARVSE